MQKMKNRYRVVWCLLLAAVMLQVPALAKEAPRFQLENAYSISDDGTVRPCTYYVNAVQSTIQLSGTTITYSVYANCVRPIRHIQARVVVQRYESGGWQNYVTAYYHSYNNIDLDTSDSIYNCLPGQYRTVVEYTAEDTYSNYVYDESQNTTIIW